MPIRLRDRLEGPQMIKRSYQKTRAELLADIEGLPANAYLGAHHAAAYLGTTIGVLANWRSQRVGPRYEGSKEFIRYRLCDLRSLMQGRANEISAYETPENLPTARQYTNP
jgi:hypothetical protein